MFKFGKKKDSNNKASHANPSGKKVVKKRGRKAGKKYPAISELKVQESVPSAILTDLEKDVESKSGAVRKVNGGYLVIAIDEAQLELNGLSPKNKTDDLGALSASIHKDIITSATLRGDLQNGVLVLVPNDVTLEALGEFDQLSNPNEFTWALFPDNIDDDDDEARTELLKDKTDLKALTDIAQKQTPITVNADKSVTVGEAKPQTPAPEVAPKQPVNFTPTPEPTPAPQPAPVQTAPESSADDNDLNTAGLFADEPAETPSQAPQASSSAEQPAPKAEPTPVQTPAPTPVQEPVQTPTPVTPPKNTAVQPEQTAQGYQNDIDRVGLDNLYDDDLHIQISTDEFNMLYGQIAPIQLDGNTKKQPLTTELQAAVNELTNEANQKLYELNEHHKQEFKMEYVNRAQDALNSIAQQLSVTGTNTLIGKAKNAAEAKFQKNMDNLDALQKQATKDLQAEYDQRRDEAGKAGELAAKQAFDNDNLENLHNQKDNVNNDLKNNIANQRINTLADLNQKRQEIAKNTFKDVQNQIMQNMGDFYTSLHNDEKDLADAYSEKLNDLVNKYYNDDVKHQQALADIANHDAELADTKQALSDAQIKHQQELADLKAKTQQELEENKQALDRDRQKLSENFKQHLQTSLDDNKVLQTKNDNLSDENKQLNDKIAQKIQDYNQQLAAKDDQLAKKDERYQELIDKNQEERDKAEERHQKELKHSNHVGFGIGALGIVVAVLVGILLGGHFFVSGGNRSGSTGTGVNIINPAPTVSSSSSSESSSSSSDSSSSDSSSKVNHKKHDKKKSNDKQDSSNSDDSSDSDANNG